MLWLQTVAGEVDGKTGIPPPLLCLQVKDFLNGPGENNATIQFKLQSIYCIGFTSNRIYGEILSALKLESLQTCPHIKYTYENQRQVK